MCASHVPTAASPLISPGLIQLRTGSGKGEGGGGS